jgi:NADPH-dependent ferric siderophore reductase
LATIARPAIAAILERESSNYRAHAVIKVASTADVRLLAAPEGVSVQ